MKFSQLQSMGLKYAIAMAHGVKEVNKTRRNSPCFSYGDISRQAVLGLDVDPSQNKFSFLSKVCYSHSYA